MNHLLWSCSSSKHINSNRNTSPFCLSAPSVLKQPEFLKYQPELSNGKYWEKSVPLPGISVSKRSPGLVSLTKPLRLGDGKDALSLPHLFPEAKYIFHGRLLVIEKIFKPFNCYKLGFFVFLGFFFNLFLAVLGLGFCARAFSSCGKRGPLFIAVRGPLTIVTSLVAAHGLQTRRLSSCGSRA